MGSVEWMEEAEFQEALAAQFRDTKQAGTTASDDLASE
jgi:hypothetical protein